MPDLLNDFLNPSFLSTLVVSNNASQASGQESRNCRECGESIEPLVIECPFCGTVNPFDKRRREKSNRPEREITTTVASENHNGIYSILKNSDGSFSCTCSSFLKQNDVQNGAGYATCKHIRNNFNRSVLPQLDNPKQPTDWQKAFLKKLGVTNMENLTNAQAYFLIKDHLDWQGVSYREIEEMLQTHGKVSILPIIGVGIEFESHVPQSLGREGLSAKLIEAGLPCRVTGYDHTLYTDEQGRPQFKIATDGSVTAPEGFQPMEVVTPKLFGEKGFGDVSKMLQILKDENVGVNRSCSAHVHVSAYDYSDEELLHLALVWAKIEAPVLWYFVSPSRRNHNFYCKRINGDYLERLTIRGASGIGDRCYSLNVAAFNQYKTVEFRLHNGTTNAEKIIPWVIFLMKLVESVKNGLRHSEVEATLEGVFKAVGMIDSAITPIQRAREFLAERYERFQQLREDLEDTSATPTPINLERIDDILSRRPELLDDVRRNYEVRQSLQNSAPALAANSIRNIRHLRASRHMWTDMENHVPDIDAATYTIPGISNSSFTLTREGDNRVELSDKLTCRCAAFRRGNFCLHSINLAQHLFRKILDRDYPLPANHMDYIRQGGD
ncbi:MAG: hypothetical protein IEMM0002_1067 [bacterium]|nr:MAG: hypothetical protein IEMM0002_1067 [bacterium]